MSVLLAVDPSLNSVGAAVYVDGKLKLAERVKLPAASDEERGARCVTMALTILGVIERASRPIDRGREPFAFPRSLVFEWPQIYRASKSEGDPNDLIGLAGVGGAIAGLLAYRLAVTSELLDVVTPVPATWTGQIPKTIKTPGGRRKLPRDASTSPRGIRIVSRLDADERAIAAGANHDTLDAVGLGLWRLGRYEPRRIISRGIPLA